MNQFTKVYDEQRKQGIDCTQAYVYASGKLSYKGTIDDLQVLYMHYVTDLANVVVEETEELIK